MEQITIPYCGDAPVPAELLLRWNFDPFLILMIVGVVVLGWAVGARPVPLLAGGAVLMLLFVSPLCPLASALFSARVAHHVILATVAAPLFAAALPKVNGGALPWSLAHVAVFGAWLVPEAYARALASDAVYWLMQLSLLGSAIGFWGAVRRAALPSAAAALLGATVAMGLAGALLTFGATALYSWHATTTWAWGLTPLGDQQLAGLIMWVPGGGAYLLAALWLAHAWFGGRQRPAAA